MGGLLPDDALVEVRSGVLAKRSNVYGVVTEGSVGDREPTVYYDVFPHQSFGPLASGRWREQDVMVLARVADGNALVLVYAHQEAVAPSPRRPVVGGSACPAPQKKGEFPTKDLLVDDGPPDPPP